MANLTPAAGYDNVPELDTTTPVLAGPGGPSNSQAQALLNRTEQLKNEMANKPDRTSADPVAETVGATAALGTSQEAARADHRHAMPGLATDAAPGFIQIAAAAIVQSLANNEQAVTPAGLASVSTALATALRLVLRDSNGMAAVATPAQFDNDASIATTEFVQRALGNFRQFISFNASTTLTAAQAGSVVSLFGPSPATFTLPSVSSAPSGAGFHIKNTGQSVLTVQRSGADAININGINLTSIALGPGDDLFIYATNNGTAWIASGSGALKDSAVFGASLATSGYQKLPSGLIIQWMPFVHTAGKNVDQAFTFPIAFPNGFLQMATGDNSSASNRPVIWSVNNATATGFNAHWTFGDVTSATTTRTGRVIAVGY